MKSLKKKILHPPLHPLDQRALLIIAQSSPTALSILAKAIHIRFLSPRFRSLRNSSRVIFMASTFLSTKNSRSSLIICLYAPIYLASKNVANLLVFLLFYSFCSRFSTKVTILNKMNKKEQAPLPKQQGLIGLR